MAKIRPDDTLARELDKISARNSIVYHALVKARCGEMSADEALRWAIVQLEGSNRSLERRLKHQADAMKHSKARQPARREQDDETRCDQPRPNTKVDADAAALIQSLRERIAALESELSAIHGIFKKHVAVERKKMEDLKRDHETAVVFLEGQLVRLRSAQNR